MAEWIVDSEQQYYQRKNSYCAKQQLLVTSWTTYKFCINPSPLPPPRH